MNRSGFFGQHRSKNHDGFAGPLEQLAAGDQEVRAGQHRKLPTRERVDHIPDSSPVHLARTHRAGFTARVQDRAPHLIAGKVSNGGRYEIGFSVSGRVTVSDNRIGRGQHDFTIQHEKRPERMVALATGLAGESNGLSDELLMHVHERLV